MTTQNDDTKRICHECIGEEFLADVVTKKGHRVLCSYCGGTREALTLQTLADCIHEALQKHFEMTASDPSAYEYTLMREGLIPEWVPEGEPVADVIAGMASLSERVAGDVTTLLSSYYSYRAVKDGGEDPYGSEAFYEERRPDDGNFRGTWSAFRDEIRTRARFFSPYAEEMLVSIFGDLTAHKGWDGRPVIREIGPGDEDRFLWRARAAQSVKELKVILESPVRQIGPPPSRLAKGGRMNASGVPVFYGAVDEGTCVAEVRAPVGSYVVVGRFELLRPVRLLDLDALAEVDVEGSYFDPDYAMHKGRAAFLRQLVTEISRPVMPQDEAMEHLATQAVAEYLANKSSPRLDGIIFRSSQTGGVGHNLVLFNHACGVAPCPLPEGTDVEVYIPRADQDDEGEEYGGIHVIETVPSDPPKKLLPTRKRGSAVGPIRLFNDEKGVGYGDEEHDALESYSHPTLLLDVESVKVLDIKSVKYDFRHRVVGRSRTSSSSQTTF